MLSSESVACVYSRIVFGDLFCSFEWALFLVSVYALWSFVENLACEKTATSPCLCRLLCNTFSNWQGISSALGSTWDEANISGLFSWAWILLVPYVCIPLPPISLEYMAAVKCVIFLENLTTASQGLAWPRHPRVSDPFAVFMYCCAFHFLQWLLPIWDLSYVVVPCRNSGVKCNRNQFLGYPTD